MITLELKKEELQLLVAVTAKALTIEQGGNLYGKLIQTLQKSDNVETNPVQTVPQTTVDTGAQQSDNLQVPQV